MLTNMIRSSGITVHDVSVRYTQRSRRCFDSLVLSISSRRRKYQNGIDEEKHAYSTRPRSKMRVSQHLSIHRERLLHVRRICLRLSCLQHSFLLLRTRFCIAKTIRFSIDVSRTNAPHWPNSARLHHERLHSYRHGVILEDHRDLDDQRWDTAWTAHLGSVRYRMHWSWSSMLVDRLRTRMSNDPSSKKRSWTSTSYCEDLTHHFSGHATNFLAKLIEIF